MTDTKQSLGGKARARKLSEEAKTAIASAAAKARWEKEASSNIPKATHFGELKIGDIVIPCAVLEDGRRVISEHGIATALGSRSGASKRLKKSAGEGGALLPVFLAPSQLNSFAVGLLEGPLRELTYKNGRRTVIGYSAEILPAVCEVWLRAREAGALLKQQLGRAQNAEILLRGLANVGIIALIDEATGYQYERDRDALHKLLAVYLSEERLAWAKRFPDDFYKQIYRLKKWSWPPSSNSQRTPYIGKITNQIVYDRLPDGVLEELRIRNPIVGAGRRKYKHHQFLSEDVGQPDLQAHLLQLIVVMRVSSSWDDLERNLVKAFPKRGDQLSIEYEKKSQQAV